MGDKRGILNTEQECHEMTVGDLPADRERRIFHL